MTADGSIWYALIINGSILVFKSIGSVEVCNGNGVSGDWEFYRRDLSLGC